MSELDYDPFGEPVLPAEQSVATGNKWLKLAGNGLFWLLVGSIVLTRAIYFQPGAFKLEAVAGWMQTMLASL